MISLDNHKILRFWETGHRLHPVDKALSVLQEVFPDKTWEELANLSIGTRNALLIDVREKTFGKSIEGYVKCYECKEPLDFIADVEELRKVAPPKIENDFTFTVKEFKIRFRPLNSLDLAAAAVCEDAVSSRRLLAKRAILNIMLREQEISFDKLTDEAIDAVSSKLSEKDPMAIMSLDMQCSKCKSNLTIPFDIISFFWKEVAARAKRLMQEVDTLAKHYGWAEKDILDMSAIRRHNYMELASS